MLSKSPQAFLTVSPKLKQIGMRVNVFQKERFEKFVLSAEEAGVEEIQIECSSVMQKTVQKIRAQTQWLQLTRTHSIELGE